MFRYLVVLFSAFTTSSLAFTSPFSSKATRWSFPPHLAPSQPIQRASFSVNMVSKDIPNKIQKKEEEEPPFDRRLIYGSMWALLTGYTFLLPPSTSTDLDNSLIQTCISSPFTGEISAIFVSIFNTFPVINIIYASLLLPATKKQSLPAPIFLIGQFAFGFFTLAPYLALRNIVTDISAEEKGRGTSLFESKISILLPSIFFLFLLYNAFFGVSVTSDRITDFVELFKQSRFVQASTRDLSILILAVMTKSLFFLSFFLSLLLSFFLSLPTSFFQIHEAFYLKSAFEY